MNIRNLVVSFALLSAACTLPASGQLPCKTVGATVSECPTGQTCGSDLLCRDLVTTCPDPVKQRQCGGDCVDITKDPFNCGACGTACAPGEQCLADSAGNPKCTTYCAPGQTACAQTAGGFICENLSSDRTNCGTCGNVCPTGKVCSPPAPGQPGQCATECQPGLTNCSGNCLDLNSDDASCGACGHGCGTGEHCVNGTCGIICTPGQTECPAGSGNCIDTSKDRDNCGGCGAASACLPGQICVNSACQVSCQSGLTQCGSSCINTAVDPNNCGGCGNVCSAPDAGGPVCTGGVCGVSCPAGSVKCGSKCIDPLHDNSNCGGCAGVAGIACGPGTACQPVGGAGQCVASCPSNLNGGVPCGALCVDTQNDPSNCGACNNGCAAPDAGGPVCTGGVCGVSCPAGETACGGKCVDTNTDPSNCGGCTPPATPPAGTNPGVACDINQGFVCASGGCTLKCPTGSINCGGKCIDPLNDDANCGGCASQGGHKCDPGKSCQAVSGAGQCVPTCDPSQGFAVCPGNSATCTDTQHDPANCGACSNACGPYDNGAAYCSTAPAGCAAACNSTFSDCDGDLSNGCESNSLNDAANCGGCPGGAVCGGTSPYCVSGGCVGAPSGVQQNLAISSGGAVADWGPPCYTEAYSTVGTALSTIQAACSGTQVMVACAENGAANLLVAAAGPTATVFGGGTASGVFWYASDAQGWGFAPASATTNLASGCDTGGGAGDGFAAGSGSQRLCWPRASSALAAGARCGDREGAGSTTNYLRLVFTK